MFLFGKNKHLLEDLDAYLKVSEDALVVFSEAFQSLLENGVNDHIELLAGKVAKLESDADDLRRQMEQEMYKKSLLPETRQDLLMIIEAMDRIPTRAETILNMFLTQKTVMLPVLNGKLLELTKLSIETFTHTCDAVKECFGKVQRIDELNRVVDNNESLGDSLERKMITIIFDEDIETAEKILQKEIVLQLGSICDMCETVLDLAVICSIKRSI